LPQTFQDTIMLARSIAIKYVWVDSLCILQDDTKDWESESKAMRNVFQNAALVVAAAGSSDSTQGLFFTNRPHAFIIKLPFQVQDTTKGARTIVLESLGPSGVVSCTAANHIHAWWHFLEMQDI
jgi:hypothetical protein